MRWNGVVVFAVFGLGCSRQRDPTKQPPPSAKSSAVAAVAPDDALGSAGPALVELLHAVPATIRVSSRVANKAILPAHIADGSLQTAWNSRTGDLGGAWVDVDIPGAQIHELRFTVGHTGKGKLGEDYFAMNWRIKKVSLRIDGKQVATQQLDPERRDLQTVALPAPASHVRLEIETLVPGTKQTWREVSISELEAWGTGPSAQPGKLTPTIAVGEEPTSGDGPIDPDRYCDEFTAPIAKAREEEAAADAERSQQCHAEHEDDPYYVCDNPDPPGMPVCSIDIAKPVTGGAWRGAGVMMSASDEVYSSHDTQVVVAAKDGVWPIGETEDCGNFSDTPRCQIEVRDAKVLASGELEVQVHITAGKHGDQDITYVCSYGPPVTCAP